VVADAYDGTAASRPVYMARRAHLATKAASSRSRSRSELYVFPRLHPAHRSRCTADDWRHGAGEKGGEPAKFTNFFTDIRIHQIREMQRQVAINEGIPSFDFGEIWEGWQNEQALVHPKLVRPSSHSRFLETDLVLDGSIPEDLSSPRR
jgi:hypothetical protein